MAVEPILVHRHIGLGCRPKGVDTLLSHQSGLCVRCVVWEAFKLHARMVLSACINRHKATSKLAIQQSEERLSSLEQVLLTDPSAVNASLVRLQSRLTDQLHDLLINCSFLVNGAFLSTADKHENCSPLWPTSIIDPRLWFSFNQSLGP